MKILKQQRKKLKTPGDGEISHVHGLLGRIKHNKCWRGCGQQEPSFTVSYPFSIHLSRYLPKILGTQDLYLECHIRALPTELSPSSRSP